VIESFAFSVCVRVSLPSGVPCRNFCGLMTRLDTYLAEIRGKDMYDGCTDSPTRPLPQDWHVDAKCSSDIPFVSRSLHAVSRQN
jgi:hypothetical protein